MVRGESNLTQMINPFQTLTRLWTFLTGWAGWRRSRRPSAEALQRLTDKFEDEFAERRKIEQELAHLASFAEMDPNFVLETDLEGHVIYQNIVAQEEFPDLRTMGPKHPLLEGLGAVSQVFRNEQKTLLSRPVKV